MSIEKRVGDKRMVWGNMMPYQQFRIVMPVTACHGMAVSQEFMRGFYFFADKMKKRIAPEDDPKNFQVQDICRMPLPDMV
jgi:hypothetical protein